MAYQYLPSDLARLQTEQEDIRRRQQMAQAFQQAGFNPVQGGNQALTLLASLASTLRGNSMMKDASKSLSENLAQQFEAQNAQAQAEAEAKRAAADQELQNKIRLAQEEAKAKRDYAPRTFESSIGAFVDPTTGQVSANPAAQKFLLDKAQAGKSTTSINMPASVNENAFQKALGEKDASSFVEWRDNAVQARNTQEQADVVENILRNAQTGKLNEALATAGQYFGTQAGADLQTIKGAIQPIVLSQVKQLGSGAGITDADRKFIEAGMPGFGNDPRANARLVDIMRKTSQRAIDQYEKAQAYVNEHGTLSGFKPDLPRPKSTQQLEKRPQEMSDEELMAALRGGQ